MKRSHGGRAISRRRKIAGDRSPKERDYALGGGGSTLSAGVAGAMRFLAAMCRAGDGDSPIRLDSLTNETLRQELTS